MKRIRLSILFILIFILNSCQKKDAIVVQELKPLNYEESLSYYASYVVRGTITKIEETKRVVFYNEKVFTLHLHLTNVFKGEQKYLGKNILIDGYLNDGEAQRYKKGMELTIALTDIDEQLRGMPFDHGLKATWSTLGTVDQKIFEKAEEIPSDKVVPLEEVFKNLETSKVYHSDGVYWGQGVKINETQEKTLLASAKDKANYYTPYNCVSGFRIERVIKGGETLEGKIMYIFYHVNKDINQEGQSCVAFDIKKFYLVGVAHPKKIEFNSKNIFNENLAYSGAETDFYYLDARFEHAYRRYLKEVKKGRIEPPSTPSPAYYK